MPKKFTEHMDGGLLVLRLGAGVFLVATFGWQKFVSYVLLIHAGKSLATSGLGPLIHSMGFPAAGLLGVYAVLNESVGALLVGIGLWTRAAAFFAALSMAGALFVSLRLGEEPLRAALYLTMFSALALTGAGRFSVEVKSGRHVDAGLLVLRVGMAISFVLLFSLKAAEGADVFLYHPGRLWPLVLLCVGAAVVGVGFMTRLAAGAMTVSWLWVLYSELHLGKPFFSLPVRSVLFSGLFLTLCLTGAGRFSIDGVLRRKAT